MNYILVKMGKRYWKASEEVNWIAQDKCGLWYGYFRNPIRSENEWWRDNSDMQPIELLFDGKKLKAPQKGPWYTQRYYVGK